MIFGIGIATALLAGIYGKEIGSGVSKYIGITKNNSEAVSKTGLSVVHKEVYIKSCIASGANKSYCDCTFDEIKDLYSPNDFERLKREYDSTGRVDQGMIEAATTCAYLK